MNRVLHLCTRWKPGISASGFVRCQSTANEASVDNNTPKEAFPPRPEFDWDYLTDPDNVKAIEHNIASRKGVGNPQLVVGNILRSQYTTEQISHFFCNYVTLLYSYYST